MMRKKALAMLLSVLMMLSLFPVTALASEAPNVAAIGSTEFPTLKAAIEAADPGDTVKLLNDVNWEASQEAVLDVTGLTLDLNNHTVTSANFTLIFQGDNFTIKNGKMVSANNGSYALFIGDETQTTNITVENIEMSGGINIYNAHNVVIRNVDSTKDVTGTNYYAVWCDENAQAVIEDGSFCTNGVAVIGMASDCPETTLEIKGGNFDTSNGKPLVLEKTGVNYGTPTISGGCFTTDVTKYCAPGLMAIADDSLSDPYTHKIGPVPTLVDPAIDTTVSSVKTDAAVSESIPEDDKDAVAAAAGGVKPNTDDTALTGATNAVPVTETTEKDAAKLLAAADLIDIDPEGNITAAGGGEAPAITIVKEPYLDVTATGYSETEYSLDIEAKYNLKATTGTVDPDGSLDADKTVTLAAAKPLEVTETIKMEIPLPAGFVSDASALLYVTHTKDDGTQYVYPATVTGDSVNGFAANFDNPHGFSSFKLAKTVAAKIGDQPYVSLQAAVDAVQDDQTITLYMDNSEAVKVGRTVTFTLALADSVTFSGEIKPLNGNTAAGAANPNSGAGTYAFTYTAVMGNRNYPYATELNDGDEKVTLEMAVTEAAAETAAYQWQSAAAEDGAYSDISGATEKAYTFTPADTYWYRCLVNGEASEAVQLLKITDDKMDGDKVLETSYEDYWHVSNGTMAYTFTGTHFDILGRYTKTNEGAGAATGTTYWMNTTYDDGWALYTSTDAAPEPVEDYGYDGNPQLDALRFAFDKADPNSISMEADLADGQQAFAFGADVMIGNDIVTDYDDDASLKAIYRNGQIASVQMVGAESIDTAKESDPAFVLKYAGAAPTYTWLGYYGDRYLWTNNDGAEIDEYDRDNYTISNGVVVEVKGIDSGMTTSWTGLEAGGTVGFTFSVGSVADTGAEISANATANSITVPNSDPDTYYAIYDKTGREIVGWTAGNGGLLEFTDGIQPGTDYIVKAVKKSDTTSENGVITPKPGAVISTTEVSTPTTDTPSVPAYQIVVESSENGTVKASSNYAYSGTTIKLTATPAVGCALTSITVTDSLGHALALTENEDGTYSFKMPGSKVTVQASFVCLRDANCPASHFTDLDLGLWYHDGIHYCVEKDLMNGMTSTAFVPYGTITRGMIATVLYRLEGEPVTSAATPFSDVAAGRYYTDGVAWAAENGLVEGYGNGKFGPEDPITREQLATILYRYAAFKGYSVSERGDLSAFGDAAAISTWAADAMSWAVAKGLVEGRGNGVLEPVATANRAEAATLLMNYCRMIGK